MDKLKILVLDDETRVRNEIEEFLIERNFKVLKAGLPSEAFKILKKQKVDIIILDIKLPEMDGIQVLDKIKNLYPEIEVIMISGHGDMTTVIEAMRNGASDYFQKPFRLLEINNAIERTKRFIKLNTQLKEYKKNYDILSKELQNDIGHRLLGSSKAIKDTVNLMTKVAKADTTTVMITGESGTGKELIAKGIHYLSDRNKQPFYSVNCSAIPESLLESEFFGHKKGSFTGATEDKTGWFEIANNGTLFLDEISDMPLAQQAKILRVLEEKKVAKIGTHTPKNINVRVIAASNQNLEEMVEDKKFRADLYHRLCSFTINIPPLRERKTDIPILLKHFIKDYSKKMKKSFTHVNDNIFSTLSNYKFSGNIRELKNMVERAIIICDDDILSLKHFQSFGSFFNKPINDQEELNNENDFDLEKCEKNLIKKALEKANYNKSKTSELLNISWQSLDRRMKKFNLSENII